MRRWPTPLVRAVARLRSRRCIIISSSSRAIEDAAARLRPARRHDASWPIAPTTTTGLLVPRKLPDSVIHDAGAVLERVRPARCGEGTVTTYGGKRIADARRTRSCCTATRPARSTLARAIRREIEAVGGRIVPVSPQLLRQARLRRPSRHGLEA